MPAAHRAGEKKTKQQPNLLSKHCYEGDIYWNKQHPGRLCAHSCSGVSQHRGLHPHGDAGATAGLAMKERVKGILVKAALPNS